jgi:hypothetical protein
MQRRRVRPRPQAGRAVPAGGRGGGRRSALKEFDSSALAVLLECRREALAAGKDFSVTGLPPRLRQLAGLYGVAELIPATPA